MEVNAYIVDNFYSDVDEVREFALQQDFGVRGNYPGQRTIPFLNESITSTIESIIEPQWGKITDWGDEYTGAYQYTTAKERSWIHSDHTTKWAGVCYLTPNAPLSAGTGLFKHKETGLVSHPLKEDGSYDQELMDEIYKDSQDYTKWEMTDRLANVYNRLVIYRGDFFHQSLDYFGRDKYDGRLFQTFFFNTERLMDFVKRGANISHKYKFVWTAPAKVASRSVRDIFLKYCDLNPDWPSDEHPSNFTHVNNWPEEAGDDYIHIASIRHPYYRWLSYWKYGYHGEQHEMIDPSNGPIMCLQSMSEDWINGWNQWDLINNTSKTIDLLIRAENIKEDLKELWFMPDDFEVPFLGKTDYPTINFDENHLRQVCVERFSNDYIKFGYEKDEVYEIWERPKKKFRFR